ncbi:hypothetical protein [Hydrogenobaculum acidophilum]
MNVVAGPAVMEPMLSAVKLEVIVANTVELCGVANEKVRVEPAPAPPVL